MILKWPMEVGAERLMPRGTQVIHFGLQEGRLMVWTRDVSVNTTRYAVEVYPTGATPPAESEHLGTVIDERLGLVWHLFGQALHD